LSVSDGLPASAIDRAFAYSDSLARSLLRLTLRRVRRTAEVVDADYNLLHWRNMLSGKKWLGAKDLKDFLTPADSRLQLRKVDGQIVRMDDRAYYSYRTTALSHLIARHAGDVKRIVELGAGYGHILFSLYLSRPDWTFRGFDIAPNGVTAGNEIANHFGLSDAISLDRIDLTDANDPNWTAIKDRTAFTHFCIEQIPYDVGKVVENIIAAKPKRVINIEPTTELLDLTKPRDVVSFAYIRSVDYQTKLFTTLDELERQGRIRVLARERMQFAPTIHNDGFLYCWEPVEASG
jgi:hypothetical protein